MSRRFTAATLLASLACAACLLLLRETTCADQDRNAISSGATSQHWTGTDQLGRDRTTRTAAALLLGLTGAVAASAISTALAAGVGTLAAFSLPVLGSAAMLLVDVFLTLPWLFLLMMVRASLPLTTSPLQSALVTFAVLAALGWPACARAVYRGTLTLRSSTSMVHGLASGLRTGQLIRLHILPHLRPLILPQFLICIPAFIVAEANLGTLGLGIAEPLPSWGAMLLELDHSTLLAGSGWVYLPVVILILVLLLLDLLVLEV